MTEEFWAQYKKKKDATQTNMLWKNVLISFTHTYSRSQMAFVKSRSERSIQMNCMRYVGRTTTTGGTTEPLQNLP